MDKVELALEVIRQLMKCVEDLKNLTGSVETVCKTLSDGLQSIDAGAKEAPKAVKESAPAIPLEKVRGILAEKSRAGYAAEVRAIIAKHGADKLSGVAPGEYAAILKEAEALGNA